jgi:hypothetical protein
VLDQSLQGVIGFDRHSLTQTSFGAIARLPNGIAVYNLSGRKSQVFDQVNIVSNRVAVRKNRSWNFYDPVQQEVQGAAFDSIRAEGPFVVALRGDTVLVYFAGNVVQSFLKPQKIFFVPGMDSTSFLVVQGTSREKHVFDLAGRKLFAATFDAMEYAGQGIFVVTRRDRKGLVNIRGESLLPAEFDAIGSVKEQVVSVLKNRKFGAYHIDTRKFIRPQYDRNPVPYTPTALLTFKDGFYGFLGWDNKSMSPYEFEEVTYWNDSLALVKMGGLWNLYDIYSRKISESNLKNIKLIRDNPDEKLAIVQKDKSFGVISSKGEVVIPITFSDVINLGSGDAPLYFTEKHITEASLYVVIYYDGKGKMLRKEIYDDAGDYDRIYCSDQ